MWSAFFSKLLHSLLDRVLLATTLPEIVQLEKEASNLIFPLFDNQFATFSALHPSGRLA